MENYIVTQPLTTRTVYGINEDNTKTAIGRIIPITPEEWVMYFSDATWKFVSDIDNSTCTGSWEEVNEYVGEWFKGINGQPSLTNAA